MDKLAKGLIGTVIIIFGVTQMFNIAWNDKDNKFEKGQVIEGAKSGVAYTAVSGRGVDEIEIEGTSEKITLSKHKDDTVYVEMTGEGKRFTNGKLILKDNGNDIKIYVDYGNKINLTGKVNLEVRLPETYDGTLNLDLTSGDIRSKETFELKDLKISLTSGDINLQSVVVDTPFIEMTSGDINIAKLYTKKLKLEVGSGDLRIDAFRGGLDGAVTSGDVDISYDEFNDNINLDVTSGSVKVLLPRISEFNIKTDVTSGKVSTDFDIEISKEERNSFAGAIGNSENNIDVELTSGSVKIDKY